MKITSSYGVQLKNVDFDFKPTVAIYRAAVSFCINVINKEWNDVSAISGSKERQRYVETLIHSANGRTAKYDFDSQFVKFPSYLRRDAISSAIGSVSSYRSNLQKWLDNPIGKEPTLTYDRNIMPVFYRKNMYLTSDDPYKCQIKVYLNNDWVWRTIHFVKTDVKYLEKHFSHLKPSAPTLEKRFGTYYLRFAYEEYVTLNDMEVENQTICSVDLGVNSDAVCTIMTSDGTVHARKFINFACEKDQLWHLCNRIKKQQRKYGPKSVKRKWNYATSLNKQLSVKIAAAITEFAYTHGADVIVFEHLDIKSKKRGSKAQKLHLWRKNGIQAMVADKAHRLGMHISRICARNTSKLAYDGSGEVVRDSKNHALATFQNGKQYNCDLSASYNIAARYFVRELVKPLGKTLRSQLLAKVPEVERRTYCTYSTLLKLNSAIAELC